MVGRCPLLFKPIYLVMDQFPSLFTVQRGVFEGNGILKKERGKKERARKFSSSLIQGLAGKAQEGR